MPAKKPKGQPKIFDAKRRAEFLKILRKNRGHQKDAADQVGIHVQTVEHEKKTNKRFKEAVKKAVKEGKTKYDKNMHAKLARARADILDEATSKKGKKRISPRDRMTIIKEVQAYFDKKEQNDTKIVVKGKKPVKFKVGKK